MDATMPATSPVVRTLGPSDAAKLAALSSSLGAETFEDWSARLRDGSVVVGAEQGDELVGYAAGDVRRSFGLDSSVGWIDAFGVALTFRGHGLGRMLAAGLLGRFRALGARHVYTLVPVHDRAVAPFFRDLGFRDEPLACLGRDL
jgi:ribosomal protein S18 acetylase RimI-like enzyme